MDKKEIPQKKTRDCAYINVLDPYVRNDLATLTGCPIDATNFIFWYVKNNPEEWGLTIKSVPRKEGGYEKGNFTSQHTWKITWVNKEGLLQVANHCKSLASDIASNSYEKICTIYKTYKK